MFNPPDWSDTPPTKAGHYWLSFHPDKREGYSNRMIVPVYVYFLAGPGQVLDCSPYFETEGCLGGALAEWKFEGAKWAPRYIPTDPFTENSYDPS